MSKYENKYIEEASDLNVEGVEFFIKDEPDGYIYEDEACENKATCETLKHTFEMNDIVIIDNNVAYRAIGLSINDGVATVTYLTVTEDNNVLVVIPKQVVSYDEPVSNEEIDNSTEPLSNGDEDDNDNDNNSGNDLTGLPEDEEPEETTTPPEITNGGNDANPTDPTPSGNN